MLPASNRGTGMNAGFPDVCNTPVGAGTSPIPYPNVASASSASTFATIVYVGMVNALNLNSSIPNTSGDEAGTAQPNMGKAGYTMGNPIVNVEKVPAISLACPTNGNNYNCTLAAVVVPAVSVVSYTSRAGGLDGEVVAEVDAAGVLRARLGVISHAAVQELVSAAARAGLARPVAVELDLRGCPGGDLEAALRLAGRFALPGTALARVVDEDGDAEERRSGDRAGPWQGVPVRIAVDALTASAAEVLTGALQAAAAAEVTGGPTFGKGRIEVVRAGARWPAGEVLLPSGARIEGRGVGAPILYPLAP